MNADSGSAIMSGSAPTFGLAFCAGLGTGFDWVEKGRTGRECQEKWRKQRTTGKVSQVIKGGGFEVGALRDQGCTNRARSEI